MYHLFTVSDLRTSFPTLAFHCSHVLFIGRYRGNIIHQNHARISMIIIKRTLLVIIINIILKNIAELVING